jgi:hypothetical protein
MVGTLALTRDVLQIVASVAVILLAFGAWRSLRAGREGNPVQLDIDLQVIELGAGEQIGELMVVLQNVGRRTERVSNLFVEVRPSRHAASGVGTVVPATNLIAHEDMPLPLPPGLRHMASWTFEIPREERLLRVTVATGLGAWIDPDTVPALNQKAFVQFGPTIRYLSRVFDVSSAGFRRF